MSSHTLGRVRAAPSHGPLRTPRHALLGALLLVALGLATAAPLYAADPRPAATARCPTTLDVSFPRLQDDAPQDLCQYQGKVLLVVNTASYCGYTRQYEGLEKLYDTYRTRGLVVLAFPSNDFAQEGGTKEQIADLCFNTYGVKFPIFGKTVVTGKEANPLFVALTRATGQAPKWNFHKYLIDRDGKPVAAYPSAVEPLDKRLRSDIEKLLATGVAKR